MLVVVTPATQARLTTIETVRARLKLSGSVDDDTIGGWIDAASEDIANYCERVFARETLRETFLRGAFADRPVRLARMPAEIRGVTLDGRLLEGAAWYLDPDGTLSALQSGDLACWQGARLVVEYDAGWILPGQEGRTLPRGVEEACLTLVAAAVASSGRDPLIRSESVEGVGSTSYTDYRSGAGGLPLQVAERLARYVRYSVA